MISKVGKSNKIFRTFYRLTYYWGRTLTVCQWFWKKNLSELYVLPKIHKRLYYVPGKPVISNSGTPAEKTSEFLNFRLKPVMESSWSSICDFRFCW